ncbi:glycosyltransferase family 2 protein [Algoriphagus kandeliae]|uniref:Glycosyltransferase family 2 protein n=1 Tax=Algoriphagus kandeliae TaxID=2562278 RepID=A0A4Y9QU55_9BACT|nr:glycosyltransferase family 2 protein [Algoriphagus kandeliae]TFV94696.1 glycosyltransferase family 2 protein [Algoriphagus kandeliae]
MSFEPFETLQEGEGNDNPGHPLVSVCVPTFQHRYYISDCLDSILAQKTDFRFEILVGEDCSTDGTREICINYAKKFPEQIRLFLRKEEEKIIMFGRRSGRLNHLGLYENAKGKYVCFCDGDDFWCDPLKLQKQVTIMEKNPELSICVTNTRIEGGGQQFSVELSESSRLFNSKQLHNKFYMGHVSSWMVRNRMKKILQNQIVKKPIHLDKVLFQFYKLEGSLFYLSDVTSVYRFNPSGIYLSKSERENHKAQYKNGWFLFWYLHKDPTLFLRHTIYSLRRGFNIFVLKRFIKK